MGSGRPDDLLIASFWHGFVALETTVIEPNPPASQDTLVGVLTIFKAICLTIDNTGVGNHRSPCTAQAPYANGLSLPRG
jgi:hypothetical protein